MPKLGRSMPAPASLAKSTACIEISQIIVREAILKGGTCRGAFEFEVEDASEMPPTFKVEVLARKRLNGRINQPVGAMRALRSKTQVPK